jgi:cell division protein FtsX
MLAILAYLGTGLALALVWASVTGYDDSEFGTIVVLWPVVLLVVLIVNLIVWVIEWSRNR